jgi:hypothetical protein
MISHLLIEDDVSRLLKNAHLRRYPYSSSLRRTSMYASILGISDALHPDVFEQPAGQGFFSNLLEPYQGNLSESERPYNFIHINS